MLTYPWSAICQIEDSEEQEKMFEVEYGWYIAPWEQWPHIPHPGGRLETWEGWHRLAVAEQRTFMCAYDRKKLTFVNVDIFFLDFMLESWVWMVRCTMREGGGLTSHILEDHWGQEKADTEYMELNKRTFRCAYDRKKLTFVNVDIFFLDFMLESWVWIESIKTTSIGKC